MRPESPPYGRRHRGCGMFVGKRQDIFVGRLSFTPHRDLDPDITFSPVMKIGSAMTEDFERSRYFTNSFTPPSLEQF